MHSSLTVRGGAAFFTPSNMKHLLPLGVLIACTVCIGAAETPHWIWFQKSKSAETRFFRKTFNVEDKITKAELTATADDALEVFLNGEQVLKNTDWHESAKADVTGKLRTGRNVLAIRGHNKDASSAAALAKLEITTAKGMTTIVTDSSWNAAVSEAKDWTKPDFNDSRWAAVKVIGKLGARPWGDVFAAKRVDRKSRGKKSDCKKPGRSSATREPTPTDQLYTLSGFKVELVCTAQPEEGSWVAMTKDDKGRLIVSPQWGKAKDVDPKLEHGLLRITLGTDGKVTHREFIAKPLFDA